MLTMEEIQVWCSNCDGKVYLFPNLIVDKKLFVPCETFYRQQDRYGRDNLFVKFPLNAKIFDRRLVKSKRHTTYVIWSFGRLVLDTKDIFSEKELILYSVPDYNHKRYEYNLISNRKGSKVIARDDKEEMELVF